MSSNEDNSPVIWDELAQHIVQTYTMVKANLETVQAAFLAASIISKGDPSTDNEQFKDLTGRANILARDVTEFIDKLTAAMAPVVLEDNTYRSGAVNVDDIAVFHNTYSQISLIGAEAMNVLTIQSDELLGIIATVEGM